MNFLEEYCNNEETISKLIAIDNDIMVSNDSFKSYYDSFKCVLDRSFKEFLIKEPTVFITDGDPNVVLDILRRVVNSKYEVIIYVGKSFLGMNKWLMDLFYKLTNNTFVSLSMDNNYNKFIKSKYKVVPIGEEALVSEVFHDFY